MSYIVCCHRKGFYLLDFQAREVHLPRVRKGTAGCRSSKTRRRVKKEKRSES